MTRLLAAAVLAFAMTATLAHAAPKHSRHHHARSANGPVLITCDNRGCSDNKTAASGGSSFTLRGSLVDTARRYVGDTAAQVGVRRSLWCMAALNKWLRQAGLKSSGSDAAKSALGLGPHVSRPRVGAIAFMYRKGGGHAGVVSGVTADGDPVIISGNHNNVVKEAVYPREKISTYVLPEPAGSG